MTKENDLQTVALQAQISRQGKEIIELRRTVWELSAKYEALTANVRDLMCEENGLMDSKSAARFIGIAYATFKNRVAYSGLKPTKIKGRTNYWDVETARKIKAVSIHRKTTKDHE